MCEQIAHVRRKLQRINKQHILFLDETHKREGDVDNYTIVLPGESPYIETSSTSSYARRFDMIACCSGTTTLPPIIYSPSERDKGVTSEMLHEYIRTLLAQSAGALDVYPLLLYLDRSPIHSEEKIKQEFHDWGVPGAGGGHTHSTCISQTPQSARQFPVQRVATTCIG